MEALHGDHEVLSERVDRFFRDSGCALGTLLAAWARRDVRTVAHAAHKLAQSSGAVGAARLRAICLRVEKAMESTLTDDSLLEALGREWAEVELELRQMLDVSVPRFI
jgi:HPt (histidine-containing phosphotransfer) domain-containing protein